MFSSLWKTMASLSVCLCPPSLSLSLDMSDLPPNLQCSLLALTTNHGAGEFNFCFLQLPTASRKKRESCLLYRQEGCWVNVLFLLDRVMWPRSHFPTEPLPWTGRFLVYHEEGRQHWQELSPPSCFRTMQNPASDFRNGHFPKQLPSHGFLRQGPFFIRGPNPWSTPMGTGP